MSRKQLIEAYENMMDSTGDYDIWVDEIEPNLDSMTTKEIQARYKADKKHYTERNARLREEGFLL